MFGSVEQVEELLPFRFTSTSSPTRAQVESLLAAHSAALVLRLRALGVPLPPSGSAAYLALSRIVVLLTACDVLRRRAVEEGQPVSQMAELMRQEAENLTQLVTQAPQAFVER